MVLAIVSASSLLFNVAQTKSYTCMQAIYTNYKDKAYCTYRGVGSNFEVVRPDYEDV